jgi:hypothetical protein
MNDQYFDMFIRGMTRLSSWLAIGIIWLSQKLIVGAHNTGRRMESSGGTRQTPQDESKRQAGCREVVLGYANHLGYIARECMSREEIEQKIDSGIDPQELASEIQARIDARPGIVLGNQTFLNHQIKLPYSYRDRHIYIVGRSGSGKTNLIRNMMMQDLANGCGVGVLAPEAELLTEEIPPYIPQDRMDDVVYINPADTEYPIPFNPLELDEGAQRFLILSGFLSEMMQVFARRS